VASASSIGGIRGHSLFHRNFFVDVGHSNRQAGRGRRDRGERLRRAGCC
jgi:hypothetical protein